MGTINQNTTNKRAIKKKNTQKATAGVDDAAIQTSKTVKPVATASRETRNKATRRYSRQLALARRLVLKIGSSLLVGSDGRLRRRWLRALAGDVASCRAAGQEVVLVSSGAIALGRRCLGLPTRRLRLEESQAAAAAGQGLLIEAYQSVFESHRVQIGQILLTMSDTERRRSYLNVRETMETLLSLGALPLVNENDSMATEEIRFGDNDRLAARVAQMVQADTLILFSDVNGLYSADPSQDPHAVLIPEIHQITSDIEAMAGSARPGGGSGGMVTKLMAAKIALAAGCRVAIASGYAEHALARLDRDSSSAGTWFFPSTAPKNAHLGWIASTLNPAGFLVIDAGAIRALRAGKSLLPPGVLAVEGDFERGDVVNIQDSSGHVLGRGLVAYDCDDACRIIGHKTDEIEDILGYPGRVSMIHRDNLALD